MMETEGRMMTTARTRLAAIAAKHSLDLHPNPTSRPLVKASLKCLAKERGRPRNRLRA